MRLLSLQFSAAIILSAFLLFILQPMTARSILPLLGGSPAVWNTSMVFYQGILLLGYLYAHLSAKYLGVSRQPYLHILLIGISLLFIPLAVSAYTRVEALENPIMWLIATLTISVGFPLFVLCTNAPMLQKWFATTSSKDAADPYFLYAASNMGSFAALIAYPLLIEPFLGLKDQLWVWSLGYVAFVGSVVACFALMRKFSNPSYPTNRDEIFTADLKTKAYWVVLAFVPSSLLLGVTSYITTDIASIPLFWVIPLAIYLLSFVLSFSRYQALYRNSLNSHLTLTLAVLLLMSFMGTSLTPLYILHLFCLFAICMMCHGRLAEIKPPVAGLTEFYLWISFGGVLGGLFNAIIAPQIFDTIGEYSLILVLSFLLRTRSIKNEIHDKNLVKDFALPIATSLACLGLMILYKKISVHEGFIKYFQSFTSFIDAENLSVLKIGQVIITIILVYAAYKFRMRPLRLCILMGFVGLYVPFLISGNADHLFLGRNFFGVSVVRYHPKMDANVYTHGTTIHGMQSRNEKDRLKLNSYYVPLYDIADTLDDKIRKMPIGVTGLGVGTTSCLALPGQTVEFFEIDEQVKTIASNRDLFTYLSDCKGKTIVNIVDGRIGLSQKPDDTFGLLILDAYSSDSLPVHLLTKEAVEIYRQKTSVDGIMAFNISNRHMDLAPILANIARDLKITGLSQVYSGKSKIRFPSSWVILSSNQSVIKKLKKQGFKELKSNGNPAWSDDYSNVLEPILANYK